MKIGIITDCLKRQSLEESFQDISKIGASGVQIYATTGIFSPQMMTEEVFLQYKEMLKSYGLEIIALCGDMGGYGFEIEEDNTQRISKTKQIIDLALKFDTKIVTSHIGVIPEDKRHPRYQIMLNALKECGSYAKQKGVTLAIETGPEKAVVLKEFIDQIEGGIGVNLDPANFIMVTGQDPVEAVYILKDYIVHTHIKDGIMLDPNQKPEDVYHAFAVGGVVALNALTGFKELPIGKGAIEWKKYINALKDIGYNGYLTIEREAGNNVFEDIKSAFDYINNLI